MQCRFSNTVPGRAILALAAVAVSLAGSACDRTTTPGGAVAPASIPVAVVVLTAAPIAFSPATYCATVGLLTPDLTLVVSSSASNLTVDHITLHMLDGTNLGGPGLTFPQADLNAQFVNTFVHSGASRSFVLRPTFKCSVSGPRSVQAEVGVVDAIGGRSVMTATAALP